MDGYTNSTSRLLSTLAALVALLAPAIAAAATPIYVPWPCGDTYRITQGHNSGSHTGESSWAWDVGIPVGGEVAAPADGVVSHVRMDQTQSGCDPAYATKANYVVIDLGDGTQAQLAHLQAGSSNLKVGDRVRQGDVVGRVGLSGYVCGAHLHFKIQTPCRYFTCPSVRASFVGFGDPGSGTRITSNNCPAPDETEMLVDAFDQTMSDVDGDGAADVCARTTDGVECSLSASGPMSVDLSGPALSDDKGWDDASNYSTIRLADVTGDGRADLCARANAGIRCWPSVGDGFGQAIVGPELADGSNWNAARYYSTIRMADIDGDGRSDICARAGAGFTCFRSTGNGFEAGVTNGFMKDAGWDRAEYYSTIRMADLDGDGRDDVCGRNSTGLVCWLSDGAGFGNKIIGPAWSDDSGWSDPSNYTTIRLGDVDGDGRADVCARANAGMRCHLWNGEGFGEAIVGPAWSDGDGWSDAKQYATVALADVDGDGAADVCGKGLEGVECHVDLAGAPSVVPGPGWSADAGWDVRNTAFTVRFADVDADGRSDVCGRTPTGYECWTSDGSRLVGNSSSGLWSDRKRRSEFTTIRVGGTAPRSMAEPPEAWPAEEIGEPEKVIGDVVPGASTPDGRVEVGSDAAVGSRPWVVEAEGSCSVSGVRRRSDAGGVLFVILLSLTSVRRRRRERVTAPGPTRLRSARARRRWA